MSTWRSHQVRPLAIATTLIVALSVLFAGVRAAVQGWVPHEDDAYFTARSLDVGTKYHPLVGAWSSGSADIELNVNNLGALQLYLLAPFTKIDPMAGTAIGVAVTNTVAILTIAWLVKRIGGWHALIPAMAAVAMLTWVMGSEKLITPQQHQYLMLPYLCLLVAAWAAARGDPWALVPFVVAGSLTTQTHLSYPILVGAVTIPVVVGQILAIRRRGELTTFRRPWAVAAVVAVVLWIPTAIDQFFGWGNFTSALQSSGETVRPGLWSGVRITAGVLASPRGYLRPGYGEYGPFPSLAANATVAVFVLGWILLAIGAAIAVRFRRRTIAAGLTVAFVAVGACVVDAAQLPPGPFGPAVNNYRWLWPTATFLVLGSFVAFERQLRSTRRPVGPLAFGGLALALVAMGVPPSTQVLDPETYRQDARATADLLAAIESADLRRIVGPVVLDDSRMGFPQPFTYPVAAVLSDRGVEYRFDDERNTRRFGDRRASDGSERQRLVLLRDAEALAFEGDGAVVGFVDGQDPVALVLVDT